MVFNNQKEILQKLSGIKKEDRDRIVALLRYRKEISFNTLLQENEPNNVFKLLGVVQELNVLENCILNCEGQYKLLKKADNLKLDLLKE